MPQRPPGSPNKPAGIGQMFPSVQQANWPLLEALMQVPRYRAMLEQPNANPQAVMMAAFNYMQQAPGSDVHQLVEQAYGGRDAIPPYIRQTAGFDPQPPPGGEAPPPTDPPAGGAPPPDPTMRPVGAAAADAHRAQIVAQQQQQLGLQTGPPQAPAWHGLTMDDVPAGVSIPQGAEGYRGTDANGNHIFKVRGPQGASIVTLPPPAAAPATPETPQPSTPMTPPVNDETTPVVIGGPGAAGGGVSAPASPGPKSPVPTLPTVFPKPTTKPTGQKPGGSPPIYNPGTDRETQADKPTQTPPINPNAASFSSAAGQKPTQTPPINPGNNPQRQVIPTKVKKPYPGGP